MGGIGDGVRLVTTVVELWLFSNFIEFVCVATLATQIDTTESK